MDFDTFMEDVQARIQKAKLPEQTKQLLEADIKTKEKFRKFRRVKEDLETLLAHALCVVEFKTKEGETRRMLCCSNIRFVNAYKAAKKKDFDKALSSPWIGIRTKDRLSTDTYDLEDGKLKTVMLYPSQWYVPHAWEFTSESLPALVPIVKEALKA